MTTDFDDNEWLIEVMPDGTLNHDPVFHVRAQWCPTFGRPVIITSEPDAKKFVVHVPVENHEEDRFERLGYHRLSTHCKYTEAVPCMFQVLYDTELEDLMALPYGEPDDLAL